MALKGIANWILRYLQYQEFKDTHDCTVSNVENRMQIVQDCPVSNVENYTTLHYMHYLLAYLLTYLLTS